MPKTENTRVVHCLVNGCKTTDFHRAPGIFLHPLPKQQEMRNKWYHLLKSRSDNIEWNKSRICSKHFQNHHFTSDRTLKISAVPTMFPALGKIRSEETIEKYNDLFSSLSQTALLCDIDSSINREEEPDNLEQYITKNCKCKPNTPTEARLWIIIKKQQFFNKKLMELVQKNKENANKVKNKLQHDKAEMTQSVEQCKYLIKCLQEKQASLEEQVEILTAVESR